MGRQTKTVRVNSLITPEQASEFLFNSNGIEEIHQPLESYEKAWKHGSEMPEIGNHVKALKHTLRVINKPLSVQSICALHTILMTDLLPFYFLNIRREWVKIGNKLCPPPIQVKPLLTSWCEKVNTFQNPTENDLWQAHLAYEHIHPFNDGNGRSGRLVWLLLRYKHGFGYQCVFNTTKYQLYYPQFDTFSWDQWIS